jgi:putative ABC transport system permease protein
VPKQPSSHRSSPEPRLPGLAGAFVRAFVPLAERDEVAADLASEYGERRRRDGALGARVWVWRQVLGSAPALIRRTWWRGWTGFEPRASRMQPGGPVLETCIMDLRYSARRLVRRPGYAALAVLTLALGAGGTAAIASVARPLLADPLPIAREGDVGVLWFPYSWNEAEFLHFRPNFAGFERMAAMRPEDSTLEVPGEPLRFVPGMAVTSEFFDVLGAPPARGRTFQGGDDVQGAEGTVVLSHGLWQELGADPSLVGRPLRIGGTNRTVVGVMPAGFWFPSPGTRMWLSAPLDPNSRSGRYALVGRVQPGVRMDAMDGPLQAIAAELGQNFQYPPQWDKTTNPGITPVREYLIGDVSPAVVATLVAMALILLIACVNVAALMLGQVSGRSTELAVRTALGANRGRLALQLLIESLLIGLAAGVAGALLAASGFHLLVSSLPLGALAEAARLDWTLFVAAVAVALTAGALVAAVPSFALWRGNLQQTMATTRTGGISARGGRLEGTLVVAQIALAVMLAAGAGLLIRSVGHLRAVSAGIDVEGVAVLEATTPAQMPAAAIRQAILDGVTALESMPGVRAAGATQKIPLTGSGHNWGITVRGRPDLGPSTTAFRMVSRGYLQALGMPVLRGRTFEASDREGTERVVVINEALAAKYFPGEDPIRRVIGTFNDEGERIVGVVGNAAEAALTDPPVPARYLLYEQVPVAMPGVVFVLRAARPEGLPGLLQGARAALQRDAPQLAVQRVTTMETIFETAMGPAGQIVTLLSLLAGLALLLGAIGVYGAIAHFVGRRTREYGICIALGLRPSRIVAQVVRRGVALVALGSVVGLAVAIALSGLLSSMLYGVEPTDPLALAGAVLALLMTGALAAFIPAWRASLTNPATALRN